MTEPAFIIQHLDLHSRIWRSVVWISPTKHGKGYQHKLLCGHVAVYKIGRHSDQVICRECEAMAEDIGSHLSPRHAGPNTATVTAKVRTILDSKLGLVGKELESPMVVYPTYKDPAT